MSITKSKRIPLETIWHFLSVRIRKDILIIIGLPFNRHGLPHSAESYSDNEWDNVPEDVQEKVYNFMVQL